MDASEPTLDRLTPVYPTPKNQPLQAQITDLRRSMRWLRLCLLMLLVGQIAAFVVNWREAHKEPSWPTNNQQLSNQRHKP